MSLDLTDIPDDFGSGGANLSPNGSSGEPSLKDILVEHKDALETLEADGGGGTVEALVAGDGINIDATDPANPIISSTAACYTDAWMDAVGEFVAGKVPSLVNPIFRSKLATGFNVEIERGALIGTGGSSNMDITRNGGVLKCDSGTTGNSFRIVRPTNATGAGGTGSTPGFVYNARTQKWAVVVRVLIGTIGAGATMPICCLGDEATAEITLGIVGATSTTNWCISVTGQSVQNTGTALPTATFTTVALIGDGTNIKAWNVDTGVQIGTTIAQSLASTAAMHPFCHGSSSLTASNQFYMDDWAMLTEPAA